jgi:hypothetical protein
VADSVVTMLQESEKIRADSAKLIAEVESLVEQGRTKMLEFEAIQADKNRSAEAFRDLVNTKGLPPGSSIKCLTMAFEFISGAAKAEGIATEGLREAGVAEPGMKASGNAKRRPRAGRLQV